MIHNQKEGYEILIGRHYEGAIDDNRVTARMAKACEAVISKEMSVFMRLYGSGWIKIN